MEAFNNRNPKARWKVMILYFLIGGIFLVYFVRLFNLQIINTFVFSRSSYYTIHRFHPKPNPRGAILAHRNELLAEDQLRFGVFLNALSSAHRLYALDSPIYTRLLNSLSISSKKFLRTYQSGVQHVLLKDKLKLPDLQMLIENRTSFPDFYIEESPHRMYYDEDQESLSHILGYIGRITSRQYLLNYHRGYTKQSVLGQAGLEAQYEDLLKGSMGESRFLVDAISNRVESVYESKPIAKGQDLQLTIDVLAQKTLQRALGDRVGAALLLNPSTGAIRASVSYPYYQANAFYENALAFKQQNDQAHAPFLNRVIQSNYPPGSVFKIVLAAAALQESDIDPFLEVECEGSFSLGNQVFHDHSVHGWVNLKEALAQSCDVYFYQLALELGLERLSEYTLEFGFVQESGIDLPGERKGLFPDSPQWKWDYYQDHWTQGDLVNLGIGQGFALVTPLQVANMMALVFNEGVLYKPYLVESINVNEDQKDVSRNLISSDAEQWRQVEDSPYHLVRTEQVLKKSFIDKETFKTLKEYLIYTVKYGSVKGVLNTPLQVGGKTGTAQMVTGDTKDNLHSWFVSFSEPKDEDDEPLVFVAIVEGVNPWEWKAPKMANVVLHAVHHRISFDKALENLQPFYQDVFSASLSDASINAT